MVHAENKGGVAEQDASARWRTVTLNDSQVAWVEAQLVCEVRLINAKEVAFAIRKDLDPAAQAPPRRSQARGSCPESSSKQEQYQAVTRLFSRVCERLTLGHKRHKLKYRPATALLDDTCHKLKCSPVTALLDDTCHKLKYCPVTALLDDTCHKLEYSPVTALLDDRCHKLKCSPVAALIDDTCHKLKYSPVTALLDDTSHKLKLLWGEPTHLVPQAKPHGPHAKPPSPDNGSVAVLMNFNNKYTMHIFPLPNVIMVVQMIATWMILEPIRSAGILSFPRFSWHTCKRLSLISVLYTANVGFALFGLKTLNIPMYNVVKRLTPVIVLTTKALIKRRWPRPTVTASVLLVVAGCIVAGVGDLTFDPLGYTSEMLHYNSITCLPILFVVTHITGELHLAVPRAEEGMVLHGAIWFVVTVLSCALMGCLLNWSQFLCTTSNSALTTTIVGVLKGVVAVLLGFFFLGGVPFSVVNIAGITLNTV
eukprot:gene16801-23080_t